MGAQYRLSSPRGVTSKEPSAQVVDVDEEAKISDTTDGY